MTIENGNKKELDNRYPKSIDDCSPAEWDAVRDAGLKNISDLTRIIEHSMAIYGVNPVSIATNLHNNGFKR